MKTQKYFKLQLKKASKLFPSIVALNLVLIMCITLACVIVINNSSATADKQKLKVGVLGDLSATHLDAGVAAVQSFDSSRFTVDLITYQNENEAKQSLRDGNIIGYINIPSDFVDGVIQMENVPLVYVTENSPVGFGSVFINEVALTISSTVNETQRGIFGLQRLVRSYGKEGLNTHIDNINLEFISSVINRTNVFKTEYIGVADGLSTGGYFVCGGIMLFLLLWGISCNSLIMKKDRSLEKLLISRGQSASSQVISEYFAFFLVTLVTFLIFALLAGVALQFTQIGIKELDYRFLFDYIKYVFAIIPVLLMITSLQYLFYEVISGTVGVILAQFVFALGTGYICGCLYPSHYFPVSIQKIASVLPTGVGVSYMRQTLSEALSLQTFIGVTFYFVLFFWLSVCTRKIKVRRA